MIYLTKQNWGFAENSKNKRNPGWAVSTVDKLICNNTSAIHCVKFLTIKQYMKPMNLGY